MAQEILINKLYTVFNTVVLDPGKYEHEHVFLSQVLTVASCFMELTRILMSDSTKNSMQKELYLTLCNLAY